MSFVKNTIQHCEEAGVHFQKNIELGLSGLGFWGGYSLPLPMLSSFEVKLSSVGILLD